MSPIKTLLAVATLSIAILPAFSAASAQAAESIAQITLTAQQKSSIIGYLRQKAASHHTMKSVEALIADFTQAAAHNREILAKTPSVDLTAFDKAVSTSIDQMKAIGDKDAIVALELAQIQSLMTSNSEQNFMFYLTRSIWQDCYFPEYSTGQLNNTNCQGRELDPNPKGVFALKVFLTLIAVPVDLVGLPVEFVISAVTGL